LIKNDENCPRTTFRNLNFFEKKQQLQNLTFEMVFLEGFFMFSDPAIQIIQGILEFLRGLIATQGAKRAIIKND
jgi:hypothetical protein